MSLPVFNGPDSTLVASKLDASDLANDFDRSSP
jgi:hypothetical protein